MVYLGEKAISSENVMTKCPFCGALQQRTINIFKFDIDKNNIFMCFYCNKFYILFSDGRCEKFSYKK